MNLEESITPRSDQANADDFLSGPRTLTIEKVVAGTSEQPVEIHTREMPGRPYKPSKTMRRLMVIAWGAEASEYTGRQLTLYRNPEIQFGGVRVGGIEISHLSHIDKPLTVALTATRGRRKDHTVKPLEGAARTSSAAPDRDWLADLDRIRNDEDKVEALGMEAKAANASTEVLTKIRARYVELRNT